MFSNRTLERMLVPWPCAPGHFWSGYGINLHFAHERCGGMTDEPFTMYTRTPSHVVLLRCTASQSLRNVHLHALYRVSGWALHLRKIPCLFRFVFNHLLCSTVKVLSDSLVRFQTYKQVWASVISPRNNPVNSSTNSANNTIGDVIHGGTDSVWWWHLTHCLAQVLQTLSQIFNSP